MGQASFSISYGKHFPNGRSDKTEKYHKEIPTLVLAINWENISEEGLLLDFHVLVVFPLVPVTDRVRGR